MPYSHIIFGTVDEKELDLLPKKIKQDLEEYLEFGAGEFEMLDYFIDPRYGEFRGMGLAISYAEEYDPYEYYPEEVTLNHEAMDKVRDIFKKRGLKEPKLWHICARGI